jgi:hypothetical protein
VMRSRRWRRNLRPRRRNTKRPGNYKMIGL